MRKHSLIITLLSLISILSSQGQDVINSSGTRITLDTSVYFIFDGNLQNDNGVTIINNGNICLGGDFVNNGTFISGNKSFVKLKGATQDIGGSVPATFNDLIIDGVADKTISIQANIDDSLVFNSNHVIIGNNNLNLSQNAGISGATNNKFVVTNGNGSLVKKGVPFSVDFVFPVGDSLSSFKPVTLNNSGAVDTFAVRVAQGLLPTTNMDNACVQYTYFVEESNTGGSNASLKLGWNTTDEGIWFDRTQTLIWHYMNNQWDSITGTPGATSNLPLTDWYCNAYGITDFSSNANRFIVCGYQATISITTQPILQIVCANNSISFSINATGAGLQYQWQVSTDGGLTWSIISNGGIYNGVNTPILNMNNIPFSYNYYQYQCIITDFLGNSVTSDAANLSVYPPTVAPTVSSPVILCLNSQASPLTATGTNLLWYSQPTGGTGSVNAPTPLTTNIDTTVYYVSQTVNTCESLRDSIIVIIVPLPPVPSIIINGNTTFCQGGSVMLTSSTANSYLWSNSAITQSVTVTSSGTYFVEITDINGCTAASPLVNVSALPLPPAPIITLNGNELVSTTATSYQWHLNGNIIPGATLQTYTPLQDGDYTVEIADENGCSSISAPFNFVYGGIEAHETGYDFTIFPNPADDIITVVCEVQSPTLNGQYLVFNAIGQMVFNESFSNKEFQVEISSLAKGLYFLKLDVEGFKPDERVIMKFVKE